MLAREVARSRKAKERILVAKTNLNSMEMQIANQVLHCVARCVEWVCAAVCCSSNGEAGVVMCLLCGSICCSLMLCVAMRIANQGFSVLQSIAVCGVACCAACIAVCVAVWTAVCCSANSKATVCCSACFSVYCCVLQFKYGVATIRGLLKIIGLFCKRAL